MEEGYMSYSSFVVTDKDGNEVEMAVVEEFRCDGKTYVAGSRIIGDEISDEGVYIYRARLIDDEIVAEKITDADEYEAVVQMYMELE